MSILLFCVFGVSGNSTGTERTIPMIVNQNIYQAIKYEEGNAAKLRLCRQMFSEKADLAWFVVRHE